MDVGVGIVGGFCSGVHALFGGAVISDDWYLLSQHGADWLDEIDRFFRPGQWGIHFVQYSVLGNNPTAHALVLAVLGALFAVLFRRTLALRLPSHVATTAALLWAVSPTSSTIRYWTATVPILVSMILIVLAWKMAVRPIAKPGHAVLLASASILLYESGLLLAAGAVVVALSRSQSSLRRWVQSIGVFGSVALWNLATSPKSINRELFESPTDVPMVLLGHLTPGDLTVVRAVLLLLPLGALVAWRLTGDLSSGLGTAFAGLGLACAGIAIPVVVGFPLVPFGLHDRANAMAVPGMAIFLAGMLQFAGSRTTRLVEGGLAGALIAMLAMTSVQVGSDVRQSETDLLASLESIDGMPGEAFVLLPMRSGYISAQGSTDTVVEMLGLDIEHAEAGRWLPELGPQVQRVVSVDDDGVARVTPTD